MKLNLQWVLSKEYSAIMGISPRIHTTSQRTVTSLAIMTCCQSETVPPPPSERTVAAAAASAANDTKGRLGSRWNSFQNCTSVLLHPQVCYLRWMLIYLVGNCWTWTRKLKAEADWPWVLLIQVARKEISMWLPLLLSFRTALVKRDFL